MMRSAVIIVEHDQVALIERVRDRRTYYVFPGGTIEDGETAQAAAIREAYEELGVQKVLAHFCCSFSRSRGAKTNNDRRKMYCSAKGDDRRRCLSLVGAQVEPGQLGGCQLHRAGRQVGAKLLAGRAADQRVNIQRVAKHICRGDLRDAQPLLVPKLLGPIQALKVRLDTVRLDAQLVEVAVECVEIVAPE